MSYCLLEERLNSEKHLREVSDFCCGTNEALDNFLKSEAFEYNLDGQGNTYIISLGSKIVAYYTLKANLIEAYNGKTDQVEHLPSIEIARLAVDFTLKRQGLGTYLFLEYIVPKINSVREIIGINTIMLFVEDDECGEGVKNFYETLGFKLAEEEVKEFIKNQYNDGCKLMYMSVENLQELEENKSNIEYIN